MIVRLAAGHRGGRESGTHPAMPTREVRALTLVSERERA